MKSNLRILLFFAFVCWCVDATNINKIIKVSDINKSTTSDITEDEKLKDFEMKYNLKIKYKIFVPVTVKPIDSNFGISRLFFHNVCLEINAPPPDYKS